jgi:hypothetical protein
VVVDTLSAIIFHDKTTKCSGLWLGKTGWRPTANRTQAERQGVGNKRRLRGEDRPLLPLLPSY